MQELKRMICCFGKSFLIFLSGGIFLIFGLEIIFRTDLATYDKAADEDCRQLLNHPLITKKSVAFYVNRNPLALAIFGKENAWVFPFINGVNFSPELVSKNRRSIKAVAAHELGHIQLGHSELRHKNNRDDKEFEAHLFALKLLGYDQINYFFEMLDAVGVEYSDARRSSLKATYKNFLWTQKPKFEHISQSHYRICKKLEAHPLFTKKGTEFLLGKDARVVGSFVINDSQGNIENKVYVELETLDNHHFEIYIAHELGHIQHNTPNHIVADEFAIRITSKEKVLAWLQSHLNRSDTDLENIKQRIQAIKSKAG